MRIRRIVGRGLRAVAALVRQAWIATAHGVAGACWAGGISWLIWPKLHPWLATELAARSSVHLPGAWTLVGLGGIALTLVAAASAGGVAFLLATGRESRARLWTAGAGLALVLLVLPWPPTLSLGRTLARGQPPSRAQIEGFFPGGPFLVDALPGVRWPLAGPARVTSGFGYRLHPVLGGTRFHNGIDIAAPEGTPVLAATSGRVGRATEDALNGKFVVLYGADGVRTAYCHLSALDVVAGQRVEAGQRLGASGMTGRATGPHLHFGLWRHGRAVDPLRVAMR